VLVNLGWESKSDGILNYLFQLDEVSGQAQYLSPYLGVSQADSLRDRSPALDQHYIYVNADGGVAGGMVVLDANNLTVRSELAMGEDALPPYISAGTVFLATRSGRLYKANCVTCTLDGSFGKWGVADVGEPICTPPFVDGTHIYVGTTKGHVYALDMVTGAKSLAYDTGSPSAIGGLTVDRLGGVLAFGDAGGSVYLVPLGQSGGALRTTVDGPVSSSPVYDSSTGLFYFVTEAGTLYEIPSL
jgi:outer membrane protein assembly factor BamB